MILCPSREAFQRVETLADPLSRAGACDESAAI